MARVPSGSAGEGSATGGEFFEQEATLDRGETAAFLREIADQLDDGTDLTMMGEDWEVPFTCEDDVEVEVQFETEAEDNAPLELELELEFKGRQDDGGGLTVQ